MQFQKVALLALVTLAAAVEEETTPVTKVSTKASAAASFLQVGESDGSEGAGASMSEDDAEMDAGLSQVETTLKDRATQDAKDTAAWNADLAFFAQQEMGNKPKDSTPPNSILRAAGALKHFVIDPQQAFAQKAFIEEIEKQDKEEQRKKDLKSGKTLKDAKGALEQEKALMGKMILKQKDEIARKAEAAKARFHGDKDGNMDSDQMAEYFNSKKNGNGESDANEPNFLQIGEESDVEAVTQKAYKLIQSRAIKSRNLRLAM